MADYSVRQVFIRLGRDTRITLVYLIYDYFIKKANKNIIFYMAVALIVDQ